MAGRQCSAVWTGVANRIRVDSRSSRWTHLVGVTGRMRHDTPA